MEKVDALGAMACTSRTSWVLPPSTIGPWRSHLLPLLPTSAHLPELRGSMAGSVRSVRSVRGSERRGSWPHLTKGADGGSGTGSRLSWAEG